jgi:hypothetical protein
MEEVYQEVKLTRGLVARVCNCHYHLVKNNKWYATGGGTRYAARSIWNPKTKRTSGMIYLHRLIARTPKGKSTDHIDGNTMNNFCWNLRITDQMHNNYNRGMDRRNTTGYKGVSFMKQAGTYRAYIRTNDKQRHIGVYKTDKEAALAYNREAIKQWGEYARLNIVAKPPIQQ